MLRRALPLVRSQRNVSFNFKLFFTSGAREKPQTPSTPYSFQDDRLLKALDSEEPLDAFLLVHKYREHGEIIPPHIMKRLYDVTETSSNPLYTHIFAGLVTVDQVGHQHFLSNVERVIKMQLAQRNWESCIAFIREVELANSGEIVLSYDTIEALILAAKWHGDTEVALQAVKILSETYPNVYARTWGLVFQLILDSGDYESLKWIHRAALVPGLLVVDDSSYLRIANIAARNGDLRMCEWSSLRMRRRQRALHSGDSAASLQLYICLIEAAARSSIIHSNDKLAASFQAVCRYLVRLGPLAGQVSSRDLPQTIQALIMSNENNQQLYEMFQGMCVDTAVCNEAKTITFNLLLSAELAKNNGPDSAMAMAHMARTAGVEFNEDSIMLLLELVNQGGADPRALDVLAQQCPTSKVLKRVRTLTRADNIRDGNDMPEWTSE